MGLIKFKLNKSRQLVLVLSLLISPHLILAQKDYLDGYIITNENDTLFGKVKDRKSHPFGKLYKKIYLKQKHRKRKYSPNQIKSYQRGASKYESLNLEVSKHLINEIYTSDTNRGNKVFLKVLVKGYLTYYQLEFEYEDSDYIDAIDLYKRVNESNLQRVTQGVFGLKKEFLRNYFQDCPSLWYKIEKRELKDPIEIANYYNTWKINSIDQI